ncbi:golvesin C-terminal-like domain-containing protein [Sediminitomix flava]|uniref:Fibronectin type III domain protein n=1 Tax=Sediminitomix flava TaxID=379075 RepID=A0A315ZCW8_SEDFL|nr:fibronectin type III domain-containing protein [Sediminitomix flava]PWJ43401.1 fibronectin type III domain protein [Sediminitomix flava]
MGGEKSILKKLLVGLFIFLSIQVQAQNLSERKAIRKAVEDYIEKASQGEYDWELRSYLKLDTMKVNKGKKQLDLYLSHHLEYSPVREENLAHFERIVSSDLPSPLNAYQIRLFMGKKKGRKVTRDARRKGLVYAPKLSAEELIPNFYREKNKKTEERMPSKQFLKWQKDSPQNVRNLSKSYELDKGLQNRHLALWNSHGWYYENELDRWEWQRARVFQTVEDLFPTEFVLGYIVPMLENAGANVYLPRERDWQTEMVIVDNDSKEERYSEEGKVTNGATGFARGSIPYKSGTNPFELGTYRKMTTSKEENARVTWTPQIKEPGEYAVYISYATESKSTTDARYTVNHSGGSTEFSVNQKMGGGTWIYLGTFHFNTGADASVVLSNKSEEKGDVVTADAVRFGGGMGDIERNGQISNRPRFLEAARYYLQFAGAPAESVYNLNADTLDYQDDYRSRGHWVNYLMGAPYGPYEDPDNEGLHIPVDLSFAFHTDAGTSRNDTVIGTLMIYSQLDLDKKTLFPDKTDRIANRDLADILQSQIVDDIRIKYDSAWSRRPMWDKRYSEATYPNTPSALLELLSHQNFLDMKFGNDPQFQFDVSRAIYKGMLKFLSSRYNVPYEVQPLPIQQFSLDLQPGNKVMLKWQPTDDPLEPSAVAERYVVYKREEGNGFDNGTVVNGNSMLFTDLKKGVIYSFKVAALNDGGESMPSEILAVCNMEDDKEPVLVINGFDRIAPPMTVEKDSTLLFFDNRLDAGVSNRFSLGFIGEQYNYDATSDWEDDDAPGHGASYADYETEVIAGNTFDYPYEHGKAIRKAGHSFVSTSRKAVEAGDVKLMYYDVVDLILGEQKETYPQRAYHKPKFKAFTEALQTELTTYLKGGGKLFVSGAYVGTDLFEGKGEEDSDVQFGLNTLEILGRTNHATRRGQTIVMKKEFDAFRNVSFTTELNSEIYAVEAPDGIEPANENGVQFLRYATNNLGAGVYVEGENNKKVLALGFPFETIIGEKKREEVMKAILELLQ